MKRTVTRLISFVLVMAMFLTMVPMKALAWGKNAHIFTANNIQVSTWSGSSSVQYEDSTYGFTIPKEFQDAIQSYPDAFRAGALGPDMYPDILTGQMYIHPADPNIDSGEWITYLVNSVNKLGKDTEDRKKALSFTLGVILHYCGDLFGHDFVNTFSGGSFPSVASTEMLDIKSARLNNVLSHMSVEKYMDELLYADYSSTYGKVNAPDEFVQNAMIFNGSPAAGLAPLYSKYPALELQEIDTGDIWLISDILDDILDDFFNNGTNNVPPHYTAMLALRNYVVSTGDKYRENMEPVSAAITRFHDEWAEDIDVGIAHFVIASDNIAERMVTGEKNPEIEAKKAEEEGNGTPNGNSRRFAELGPGFRADAIKFGYSVEDLDWIEEKAALGIDGKSFFDEILQEMLDKGLVTPEMLAQSDGAITIIKEELSYWWDEYGIYMLCIPDIFIDGIPLPIIGDLIDLVLLGPLWDLIIQEIKKWAAEEVVTACTNWAAGLTGMKADEVAQHIAGVVSAVDDRLEDPQLQLDHADNPYKPSENNFEDLQEYMQYLQTGEYDEFEALYNTMAMFQLVLMGPDNYSNFVQQYAGAKQTAYTKNTGFVTASALKVNIRTSNLYQSGTDDNIYVVVYRRRLDGGKYEVTTKLLDKSGVNDFESGDNDEYIIELPEEIRLDEIEIALKKTPAFDFLPSATNDWHCEDITVTPMYAGYEASEPISLGGVLLQGIVPNVNMIFNEALNRQNNVAAESRRATNMQITIEVKDETWAGSDSDIYLIAYYGEVPWAKVCLDKAYNNDLERGKTETYNIPITWYANNVRGIPLDELRIEIKHEGRDLAKWKSLTYLPCFGDLPLIEEGITRWGQIFENSTWAIDVQKNLRKATYVEYDPIECEYTTNLDDGVLYFMGSLDGGEEWMDPENEMWSNTTMRSDIFLRLFKGFTPEIEYTGETEFLLGAPPEFTLDFAGQWNGVSMERRTQVDEFQHKAPVDGNAIVEIINEQDKVVYKTDRQINDGTVSVTVPSNKLETGVYDVKVTYTPDVVNPLYGQTEEIFEDAFRFEVGPPTITKQPQNVTAFVGEKIEFFIEVAGGKSPYTYQWQYKKGNGEWQDPDASWSVGYNYTPFGFLAHEDEFTTGYQYRCVITDDTGTSVTSDVVKVLEATPLAITKQPVGETAYPGQKVIFTVDTTGGRTPVTYQWQFRSGNGKWYNADNSMSTGFDTKKFTFTVADDEFSNEYEYRCVITDKRGNSVTSDVVKVTEPEPLTITMQPMDADVYIGDSTGAYVEVTGGIAPYKYSWVYQDGSNWCKILPAYSKFSGASTNALLYVPEKAESVTVHCIITDSAGKGIISEDATLTAEIKPLAASVTPTNITIDTLGETAHFTVNATGGLAPYTYNWKTVANIGAKKTWVDVKDSLVDKGQGTNTLTCTPNQVKTYEYYCIVTDSAGNTVETGIVTATVKPLAVKINDGAAEYTLSYQEGETVTLRANATGGLGPYTCTWYEEGFIESTLSYGWIPVCTGSSYEVGPGFSHEIRLEVTDSKGNTATASVWIEVTDQIN